jgi:hypothetical protein
MGAPLLLMQGSKGFQAGFCPWTVLFLATPALSWLIGQYAYNSDFAVIRT